MSYRGKEQDIKRGTGGRSSMAGEIQKGRNRQFGERDTWEGSGDQVLDRKEGNMIRYRRK